MPKKKDQLISKQKRLIATRLMQISLLVDDYLYQQKPMSQSSAVTYIKEISGYKDKCYRDARSLQVIDKLIRCMKGIILEQQEIQGEREGDNYVFQDHFQRISNNATNVMLSPVYSTADEDLTQCIEIDDNIGLGEQIHEKKTDSNNPIDNIETKGVNAVRIYQFSSTCEERSYLNKNVTRHLNNQTQLTERDPLSNDIEVINVCDDEIYVPISQDNALRFQQESDFNIQNAITNLSIRDSEAFMPFTQECSQSILGDYHPAYSNTANSVQKEVALPLNTNFSKTATIVHQNPATEIISKEKLPKILLPTTKRIINVQIPEENKSEAIQNIVQTAFKQTENAASKPETKKRNAKNKNDIKTSKLPDTNTKQKQKNVKASDIKHKQNKPIYNTSTNTTQTANKQSNHQSYTDKQLTYSKTQHSTPTNKYSNAHKGKDRQTVPIYNRTVANDLSWIENIRFVREIPTEEYESFTQGDAFWENCTLPDNWSVDDFNY